MSSCLCFDLGSFFSHQKQEEVVEVAEEEEVEAEVVSVVERRWEWEAFSKAACQNYAQSQVKKYSMLYI